MIRVALFACAALTFSGCLSIPEDVFACLDDSGCPDDFQCVGSPGAQRCMRAGDVGEGDWECPDGSGRARLCDGRPDCDDGSDEKCGTRTCGSGETLRTAQFCDGVVDCDDGSDESDCGAVPCLDAADTQIPKAWLCDGDRDCPAFVGEPGRAVDEDQCLLCDDGEDLIHSFFYCDGTPDCRDQSDEAECFYCNFDETLDIAADPIPRWSLCDGVEQCDGGEDEAHCGGEFECGGGVVTVPRYFVCDGFTGPPDCVDGEDEDDCALTPAPGQPSPQTWPAQIACPGIGTLDAWALCQGVKHCSDHADEHRPNCPFICLDGSRIPREWVCDGTADCLGSEDEIGFHGTNPCDLPVP